MARAISASARAAIEAVDTDDAFIVLLTLSGGGMTQPGRFALNTDNVVSRGLTFEAYPFDLVLAEEDGERVAEAKLRIDNVDPRILESIRLLTAAPDVRVEIVRAKDPEDLVMRTQGFKLRDVTVDSRTIEGTLRADNTGALRYPADTFDPVAYPGLHR